MAHSKGKKSQQKLSLKRLDSKYTRQRNQKRVLKMLKELKGDMEKAKPRKYVNKMEI